MRRRDRLAWALAAAALLGAAQARALLGARVGGPGVQPRAAAIEAARGLDTDVDAQAASLAILRDCLARLPQDPAARPLERCPRVAEAVRQLGLSDGLGPAWQQRLTRGSLQDLMRLVQRYRSRAPSAAPDLAMLPPVLRELRADMRTHSWWEDFKARLRRLFQPPDPGDGSWIAQLLSAVPALAQRLLLYVTTAGVVAMALWILWKELKANGVLDRKRNGSGERRWDAVAGGPSSVGRELALSDVEAAAPAQRAALLLRLLLQALRGTGRVRGDRVLTCRELAQRTAFDTLEQRRRFETVALWAERARYGAGAHEAAALACLEQGRNLYAELLAASGGHDTGAAHEA